MVRVFFKNNYNEQRYNNCHKINNLLGQCWRPWASLSWFTASSAWAWWWSDRESHGCWSAARSPKGCGPRTSSWSALLGASCWWTSWHHHPRSRRPHGSGRSLPRGTSLSAQAVRWTFWDPWSQPSSSPVPGNDRQQAPILKLDGVNKQCTTWSFDVFKSFPFHAMWKMTFDICLCYIV